VEISTHVLITTKAIDPIAMRIRGDFNAVTNHFKAIGTWIADAHFYGETSTHVQITTRPIATNALFGDFNALTNHTSKPLAHQPLARISMGRLQRMCGLLPER